MNARAFHATPIHSKVFASISNSRHVARVMGCDKKKRKFRLRFILANGAVRIEWRSALCCEPADDSLPFGQFKGAST